MVKIAVVAANSGLALEVIDKLVEDGKHHVLALCRKDPAQFPQQPNVEWLRTTYEDKDELVRLFQGVEVVLNFSVIMNDPENAVGRRVIDAAIAAGVKRYAPSEWVVGNKLIDAVDYMPWYRSKLAMRDYLREVNRNVTVLEYTLFQTGAFLEYLATPHKTAKHLDTMELFVQLGQRRIVAVRGHEHDPIVFTSVDDIAAIVRRAVEYEGTWPEVGGIQGNKLSLMQIKEVAERVLGEPMKMEYVEVSDLEAGKLKVDLPALSLPSIPEDQRQALHVTSWIGTLYGVAKGVWNVTDEWNRIFPDHRFVGMEDYFRKVWA